MDLYWIGSGGNTSNAANWSLTSGGAGGAGVPTNADNAIFDANSGDATVNATLQLSTFDSTAYTGTLTGTFATINVFSNCYLSSTTAFSDLTLNIRGITSSSVDFHFPTGYVFNFTGLTVVVGVLSLTTINFINDLIIDGSALSLVANGLTITGNPQILLYSGTLNYSGQVPSTVGSIKMKFLGNVIANNMESGLGRTRLGYDIEIDCGSDTLTIAGYHFGAIGNVKYISGNINWNGFGFGFGGNLQFIDFTYPISYVVNTDTGGSINLLSDLTIIGDLSSNNFISFANNSGSPKTLSIGGNWDSTTTVVSTSGSDPINVTMIGTGYITGYILGNFTIAGDYDLRDIYTANNTVFTYSSGTLTYANANLFLRSSTIDWNYPNFVWQSMTNIGNSLTVNLLSDIYTNSLTSLITTFNGSTIYVSGDITFGGNVGGTSNIEVTDNCVFSATGTFNITGIFNINIPSGVFTMATDLIKQGGSLVITQGEIDDTTFGTSLVLNSDVTLDTASHKWLNVSFIPNVPRTYILESDFKAYNAIITPTNTISFSSAIPLNISLDSLDSLDTLNTLNNVNIGSTNSNNTLYVKNYWNCLRALMNFVRVEFGTDNSGTFTLGSLGISNTSFIMKSKHIKSLPNSKMRISYFNNHTTTMIGLKSHKVSGIQIGNSSTGTGLVVITDGIPDGESVDKPNDIVCVSNTTRAQISIIGKPTEICHNVRLRGINVVQGFHNLLEGNQMYAGLGLTRQDWNMDNNSGNIFHESQLPKSLIASTNLHFDIRDSFEPETITYMNTLGIPNSLLVMYAGTPQETFAFNLWNAIDDHVKEMKEGGIWNKYIALYPFIGGTSDRHAVNLKNPGTFDLTYVNNNANYHTGAGVLKSGMSFYMLTGVIPANHMFLNNCSVFANFNKTYSGTLRYIMGATQYNGSIVSPSSIVVRQCLPNKNYNAFMNNSGTSVNASESHTFGNFMLIQRVNSSQVNMFSDNSKYTENQNSTFLGIYEIQIFGVNAGGLPHNINYTINQELTYSGIGEGLTDGEVDILRQSILDLQNKLKRP